MRAEKVETQNNRGSTETNQDPCQGSRQAGICILLVRQ